MTGSSYPRTKKTFEDLLVKQEKIGSGSYGSVYHCLHVLDRKAYAVKKVGLHHSQLERCLREVEALSTLTHKNIVRYYESWTDESCSGFESSESSQSDSDEGGDIESSPGRLKNDVFLFIQMEFCPSNLASEIKDGNVSRLKALKYFSCLLEGLIYIHDCGYLHRDLTTKNIFIGDDSVIKIGDFGLAKKSSGPQDNLNCSHSPHSTRNGYDLYRAPELLKNPPQPYTAKSDLYSLGIIFFEMLHPYVDDDMGWIEIVENVRKGEYPGGWEDMFETQLLRIILADLPNERSTAVEVLQHIQSQDGKDSFSLANPKKRQRAEDDHSNLFKNLDDRLPMKQHGPGDHISLEDLTSLRSKVVALEEEARKVRQEASNSRHLCNQLEKEIKEEKEQQVKPERQKALIDLLISNSKAERREARRKVSQDCLRLGNVGVNRVGTVTLETWEDGQAIKDVNVHLKQLLEKKEAVERQQELLKNGQSGAEDGYYLILDEIYKSRLAGIEREEETLIREKGRYEIEKGRLIREMKRIRDEDGSHFNKFPLLNDRYAFLNLLGKGGFSEVYKSTDMLHASFMVYMNNAQWTEEKKKSYLLHANRENSIHKTLVHHHIVQLWDTFEIDQNTFCTVLEYCSGKDLDAVLKETPILPEKEARVIIVQIFQALVYLNKRTQKIIHYDLKPGNVLFDEFGVAKITDFGLSKIMEGDFGSQGMALTSQGAGTYWYLPPECFELSRTPFISSKVDVWSAGVLMYQMLFGRRPFGHGQTQDRIIHEGTISNAHRVEFPPRPTVSSEVKEFIRRCLTYNQAERPDVLTMALDPYLTYTET